MKLDIQQMMKQAQKMQQELARRQEELAVKTFEASSGGGMVTVVVSGKFDVLSIKIDPEVVDKNEIDMLQDLIVAAVNQAVGKAQEAAKGLMSGMMGGGMPDIGSLLG